MESVATIQRNMAMAIGTEGYIKHSLVNCLVFTDGIKQLREDTDAFWLVDAIASYQPQYKHIPFQLWELKVNEDKSAVLTMKEDSNTPVLVKQEFDFTDFPLKSIKFYVEEGGYGTEDDWHECLVLMLPSER